MANNNALYDAAVGGAGGAAQHGWLVSTNAGDYVAFAVNVDILAVAIDLQIAPIAAGPSISQINLLQSITEAVLSARYPIANIPATYVDIGRAIATLFNALSPLLKNNPTIITNILAGTGISVSIVNSVATISSLAAIWQTVFDIDLAALPTSWSNANGVYAMGGYNWTKYGTAFQRGAGVGNFFGIENGVGFRTQTASASSPVTQNISNRPYLTLSLSSVIPLFSPFMPIRLSWITTIGGSAINDLGHYAGFAIQDDATAFRINWTQEHKMTNNPAVALSYMNYAYSSPIGTGTGVSLSSNAEYLNRRICRTTMPQGIGSLRAIHEMATGVNWPIETDWLWTSATDAMSAGIGTTQGPGAPLAGLRNKMVAEIGASANGTILPGPWFSKLKLEAMY